MNKLKIVGIMISIGISSFVCKQSNKKQVEVNQALSLIGMSEMEKGVISPAEYRASGNEFRARANATFESERDSSFTYKDDVWITAQDGKKIAANVMVPTSGGSKFPAVIFVSSWASDEYQYLVPAGRLAKKGYIVLSYTTRGFGKSEGVINVAGPNDMSDLSSVIDYLESSTPVDITNIGISGISYGGGISLLGLSREPRIKTAVAMSCWGSLPDSLYGNSTPRLVWGLLLITAGYFTGTMDPEIQANFRKLLENRDVESVLNWAKERSPVQYVDLLNKAGKPVYISQNFSDNLFQPNQILAYFEKLTVTKKLDLSNGIHGSYEGLGLDGSNNLIWTNTYDWFDYWLKGVQNGILNKPRVTMEKRFSSERVSYTSWPLQNKKEQKYFLKPMSLVSGGAIESSPFSSWWPTHNSIYSSPTIATTGVPLLGELLDGVLDTPVYTNFFLINRTNAAVYVSDKLSTNLKIRGRSFYKGTISATDKAAHVVVYLYEVDDWGTGKLISHGTSTTFGTSWWSYTNMNVDLQAVAYDIPAGKRIGIAIDTVDPMYAPPPPISPYTLAFNYNKSNQTTLTFESE